MSHCNTIFNQLLGFLPRNEFNAFVGQHNADKYVKKLNAWNQLIALLFAQATGKDSLREIELGLTLHASSWYHLGIKSVARSTLADANNRRSYQIFEKLFYNLVERCKEVTPQREFKFKNPLYSLDATTIQLCLNVFDWAKYRTTKGAIKIHTVLNNKTTIPELINITVGNVADITNAQAINLDCLEKESIIVFDRAFVDYEWWNKLDENEIFFVSRVKKNQNIFVLGQHNSKLNKGIITDEIVMFGAYDAINKYDKKLRRVKYYDEKKGKVYEYLTNNFKLSAHQIAMIYKDRWQIEIFFKWIKQNLKIKSFLGTSENAVMTQIWIAMIYYLLLSYIKFQTKFEKSLLALTRMIRETLMIRRDLIDLLSLNLHNLHKLKNKFNPQLAFF